MTEKVSYDKDGFPIRRKNHDLALPALIASLIGFVVPYASIAGIIMGFIAMSQIKKNPDKWEGKGMALAGVVLGFASLGIKMLAILLAFVIFGLFLSIPFFFLF